MTLIELWWNWHIGFWRTTSILFMQTNQLLFIDHDLNDVAKKTNDLHAAFFFQKELVNCEENYNFCWVSNLRCYVPTNVRKSWGYIIYSSAFRNTFVVVLSLNSRLWEKATWWNTFCRRHYSNSAFCCESFVTTTHNE